MSQIGARVRRIGDERLLRGGGRYVGDLRLPAVLHVGFVRSSEAHARLRSVDLSVARPLSGVVAAHAGGDLSELGKPTEPPQSPPLKGRGFHPLARDVVRFVGEPIAVVLAETREALTDAVESVQVEYEPLEPSVDIEAAMSGGPRVWEDLPDNIALDTTIGFGDVDAAFQTADVIVEERISFARSAGVAMEPRAVAAVLGGDGEPKLTLWDSTQAPHIVRDQLARYFGLAPEDIRVVAPDVGGGFGVKGRFYPEEIVLAALALRYRRPVQWVATRTEDLLTTGQGRGQIHHARLAARGDGTILAIDDHIIQDAGAYTSSGLDAPMNTVRHLPGPYRSVAARARVTGVYTNTVMTCPLRGGGRPEGVFVMERLVDRVGERLGLNRAEIRRRNFIPPDDFPHDTGMPRVVYDSGNFPEYLARALRAIDFEGFAERQAEARTKGRYLGLGLAAFIESTGFGIEGARVLVQPDGDVRVAVGSSDQGQGHPTAFAQVAAERLGVPLESVRFVSGDTGIVASGSGTYASRMAIFGGNAVSQAAREVNRRAREIAGQMLEIAPDDLQVSGGWVGVKGLADRGVSLATVSGEAERRGETLQADVIFRPERQNAWAGGVNAAIVDVDVETGKVRIERYVVVHDAGVLINPTGVEGQIDGGVAHGIGNALFEAIHYSADGQLMTATLADYSIPLVGDVPAIEIEHVETPSPFNPEGIKGAGEAGTIAAIPTLVSAIEDALQPFGIRLNGVPISQETIALAVGRTPQGR